MDCGAFIHVIILIGAKHILRKVAKRNETLTGTDNNTLTHPTVRTKLDWFAFVFQYFMIHFHVKVQQRSYRYIRLI